MEKQIASFIESLKSNKRVLSFDEASTKQAIVIRILSFLGWDIFNVDEVKPDHVVKPHVVDFSLRPSKIDMVFINVKPVKEELSGHQKVLLNCAMQEGVKLCVLSNGILWWFYLSFKEGSFEQRRYCSIDLFKHSPEDIAKRLIDLLEKENVATGKSLKKAETLLEKRQSVTLEKSINAAWIKLLAEPNQSLVKLLNDGVEKICGYRAERERLVAFLTDQLSCDTGEIIDLTETVPGGEASYEGTSIVSFSFKGDLVPVEAWSELLVELCEILMTQYRHDIEKLLWHSIDGRFHFRENPDELRLPANVEGTGIFVETHLSPDETVKTARSIVTVFEHSASDLQVQTEE